MLTTHRSPVDRAKFAPIHCGKILATFRASVAQREAPMADALRESGPGGAGGRGHRGVLAAALIGLIMALAACGSAAGGGKNSTAGSGGSGTKGGTTVTAWLVTTGPSPANNAVNAAAKKFEASHPGDHITIDYVENQS